MEQAGRILRAQATRKQVFFTILPRLSDALIKPAEGTRKAQKDYRAIKEQVSALRVALDDPDSSMAMTNVIEQACNHFLTTLSWPTTYEELQPVPVLKVGQLTTALDDGMDKGQIYRARIDFRHVCLCQTRAERTNARLFLQLRAPDETLAWRWGTYCAVIELPAPVVERLAQEAVPRRRPCAKSGQTMAAAWRCSISSWRYRRNTSGTQDPGNTACWAGTGACAA